MPKVIAIVQARMSSRRLPHKVLADICGKPMIQHVVERARAIPGVNEVIATIPPTDYELQYMLLKLKVRCYWHHPPDVLSGYYNAACDEDADLIVRITSDCPLLCQEASAFVLDEAWKGGHDFCYNTDTINGRWIGIDGFDTEVFTRDALTLTHEEATNSDREHVTPYMRRTMRTQYVPGFSFPGFEQVKLSVDSQGDLDFVRRIMARIPAGDYSWRTIQEVVNDLG